MSGLGLGLLTGLLAHLPAGAAEPLAPPARYWTRGVGTMTVRGPRCCGDTRFHGRFVAIYEVDSAGTVTLGRLSLELADVDVIVHDGFLGLFSGRMSLRCATLSSSAAAIGRVDPEGRLEFAAETLRLSGLSSQERLPHGACAAPTLQLALTNNDAARLLHDPAGDRFGLDETFRTTVEDEIYEMAVHLEGRFVNRPPVAQAALINAALIQGGCPAQWRWTGQQWELVAEANHPGGLLGAPYSLSTDPDGAWAHGDVDSERWFLSLGAAGPRTGLGDGTLLAERVFGWGPEHRLELLAVDHYGASSASMCRFRVIDTTRPTVTPPAPLVTGCTQPGGASAATSAALRAFLTGASVRDVADPAPAALAPQTGGVDVTDVTLFPRGAPRTVSFRSRDFSGNVGVASSTVTVVDGAAPTVSLSLTPNRLPPALRYFPIAATLAASDDCGPVTLRLVSIVSNAPAFDAVDIVEAATGADDRAFYLFARLAAPGVPRIYRVTYEAKDAAGNSRIVTGNVVVG